MLTRESPNGISSIEKGRRAKWWRRKGTKTRGFSYFAHDDRKITNAASIERIDSLVIPPAWKHVRISPAQGGKIQAVGIDTGGRLQYIYNPKYAEAQQRRKFARIETFGEHMPMLRKVTNEHISLDGFPRDKVLAIMTRLMNSLYIRMGTDRSVKHFRTYGITTLGKKHVEIRPKGKVIFEFVGKSQKKHKKVLVDAELAALVKQLADLGRGRKLFKYFDAEQKLRSVKPSEINAYIRSITGDGYTAKDFRTWGASLLAAVDLAETGIADNERLAQKNIVKMVRKVAEELGNTPSVCRSSYIHPKIIKAYAKGVTLESFTPRKLKQARRIEAEFEPEEISLLKLFKSVP